MTKTEDAAFERCMDFLAQMIVRYGADVEFPEEKAIPEHPEPEISSSSPLRDFS